MNHSSNVNFIDNVSYNVVGGAFQTEAGDETGAVIGNIALRTLRSNDPLNCNCEEELVDVRESRQDFAFQGDGFWLHGTDLRVENNVVAGATGHAFIYWPEGLIELIGDKFGMAFVPNDAETGSGISGGKVGSTASQATVFPPEVELD